MCSPVYTLVVQFWCSAREIVYGVAFKATGYLKITTRVWKAQWKFNSVVYYDITTLISLYIYQSSSENLTFNYCTPKIVTWCRLTVKQRCPVDARFKNAVIWKWTAYSYVANICCVGSAVIQSDMLLYGWIDEDRVKNECASMAPRQAQQCVTPSHGTTSNISKALSGWRWRDQWITVLSHKKVDTVNTSDESLGCSKQWKLW